MDENHLSSMFRAVGYFVRRKIGCGSLNGLPQFLFAKFNSWRRIFSQEGKYETK